MYKLQPFASLSLAPMQPLNGASRMNTKTPETFLGENSSLVNLDNLMGGTAPATSSECNGGIDGNRIMTYIFF